MGNYVFAYTGGTMSVTPEEQEASMQAWGQWFGTLGDAGCLSFHETKNISCGEGGALLINDVGLADRAEAQEQPTDAAGQALHDQVRHRVVRLLDSRPLRSLGSFSYSLYLTHAPIVIAVAWFWYRPLVSVAVLVVGFAIAYGLKVLAGRRKAARMAAAPAGAR